MQGLSKRLVIACFLVVASVSFALPVYHFEITLEDATGKGDLLEVRKPLDLWLELHGNEWKPLAGRSPGLGNGNHFGRVVHAEMTQNQIKLWLDVNIYRTEYIPGCRGVYEVTFERESDDSLRGIYTGTIEGHNFVWYYHKVEVHGRASGRISKEHDRPANFPTFASGEHPRVLFRKSDLPRLRALAETDFGKAALAKMVDAVGLGVKYQLTGESSYALQAQSVVETHMADYNSGAGSGRFAWGPRWEQIALTYDLCYDGWSEDFRSKVTKYITSMSKDVFTMADGWGGGEMSYGILGHASVLYSSLGIASLAMWRDPSVIPPRPEYPFGDSVAAPTIEPLPASYVPDSGVPVLGVSYGGLEAIHQFKNCPMPIQWLYIAGLVPKEGEDPLAVLGGVANARPTPGTVVSYNGRQDTFRVTTPTLFGTDKFLGPVLDLTKLTKRKFHTTSYLFTILDNDSPRWIEFNVGGYKHPTLLPGAQLYINGVKRNVDDFAFLKAGKYALMLVAPIKWTGAWGTITIAARAVEPTEARRASNLTSRQSIYDSEIADWEVQVQKWTTQRDNQYMHELFYKTRMLMRWHIRDDLLEQGNVFPLYNSFKDIDHLAVRYVSYFERLFPEKLNPFLDGGASARDQFLSSTTVPLSTPPSTFFAPLYAIVPDSSKPAVLQKWNAACGVTNPLNPIQVLEGEPIITANAFVNYPLPVDVSTKSSMTKRSQGFSVTAQRSTVPSRILISCFVPQSQFTEIYVHDLRGARNGYLYRGNLSAGKHTFDLDTKVLSPGCAVLTVTGTSGFLSKKLLLNQ